MASAQCRDTIMVAENYSHAKIYLEKGVDRNFRSFAIQKLLRLAYTTDYGHPERAFFSKIPNFWGWADKLGLKNLRAFSVFSAKLSALILVQ